jgi:hypothetical protein
MGDSSHRLEERSSALASGKAASVAIRNVKCRLRRIDAFCHFTHPE